jgi:hypothetical protein
MRVERSYWVGKRCRNTDRGIGDGGTDNRGIIIEREGGSGGASFTVIAVPPQAGRCSWFEDITYHYLERRQE